MTTILLVEDDNDNREMMVRRLQRHHFTVLSAVDGQEAVDLAIKHLPDIILMDMALPVLNGYEATQRIRLHPSAGHIPIIGLSAHAMLGDADQAIAAGCDDYDTKPVDFARLILKIERLLG